MDRKEQVVDEVMKDLRELAPLMAAARGIVSQSPTATITVSAGGIGIWVAVTACLVTLAVSMVGGILVAIALSDLNRQTQELRQTNETQQAYINAAFGQQEKEE
jgi:hypothetical protein